MPFHCYSAYFFKSDICQYLRFDKKLFFPTQFLKSVLIATGITYLCISGSQLHQTDWTDSQIKNSVV